MSISERERRDIYIELRGEFKSEMAKLRIDTQRLMVGAIAATSVAVVAALLT